MIKGIPVQIAANGKGIPVTATANGLGVPMTKVTTGRGVPIVQVAHGGIPVRFIGSTDLFVDSVGGSNANNGLTTSTPKQTIAGIPMANNVTINLKRGSSWRETLDTTAYTGVSVKDYGSGVLPILDCADVIPNAGWTQPNVGTYPNVWQITVTNNPALSGNFASIWVNGVRLKFVNGIANVNPTVGTFTILGSSNGQYGATTTTYQVNTGTNPNSDGKTYEWAARNYGFVGANAVTVSNIHTKRNAHNNGSFVPGANAIATGCIFEDGSKHNAYFSPGSTVTNCIAWKCDWQAAERDGWIGMVAHNNINTGVEQVNFIGCQVLTDKNVFDARLNGITGFYVHTGGTSQWKNISYTDCTVTYCDPAFSGTDCNSVTHVRSHVKHCPTGITTPSQGAGLVNTLTDCWVEEGDYQVQRGVQPASGTVMDGLRTWGLNGGNDGMVYYAGTGAITVTRSAFARVGTTASGYFQMLRASTSTAAVVKGNVIWGDNTGFGDQLLWLGTGNLDHNAYGYIHADCQANGSALLEPPAYLTGAQGAGQETGSLSISTNPYTNAAAGDFSLTAGSGLNTSVFGLARFPTYQTILTSAAIAAM